LRKAQKDPVGNRSLERLEQYRMSETFRVVCPNCGQGFRAMTIHAGRTANCMKCGVPIVLRPSTEGSAGDVAAAAPPSPYPAESQDAASTGFEVFTDESGPGEPFPTVDESPSAQAPAASAANTAKRGGSGARMIAAVGVLGVVGLTAAGGAYYLWAAGGESETPQGVAAPAVANTPAPAPPAPPTKSPSNRPRIVHKMPNKTPRPALDYARLGVPKAPLETTIDDMSENAAGRYQLSGSAVWADGSLKLKDGGRLAKPLRCGASADVALWIDMPRLKSADGEWKLHCVFQTAVGHDIHVELQRPLAGARRFGRVATYLAASGAEIAPADVHFSDEIEDFRSGWWTIHCHHGLVCVVPPSGEVVHAYAPVLMEPITGFQIENPGRQVGIREIQIGVSAVPAQTPTDRGAYAAAVADRALWTAELLAGDVEAARERIEKAKETFRRNGGVEDPGFLACLGGEAALAELAGDLERADDLYAEYRTKTRALLGDAHPWTAQADFDLGASYWRRGEPEKAEELMAGGLDRFRRLGRRQAPFLAALDAAIQCAKSTDKPVRVVALEHDRIECVRALYGESDPRFRRALERMSAALRAAHNYTEALQTQKRALELARENPGEKNAELIEGLAAAVRFHLRPSIVDPDKAEEYCREALKRMEQEGRTADPQYFELAFWRLAISDLLPDGRKLDEDEFRKQAGALEAALTRKNPLDEKECETLFYVAFLSSFAARPEKAYAVAKTALDRYRLLPQYQERTEYARMLRALCPLAAAAEKSEEMRPILREALQSEWVKFDRARRAVEDDAQLRQALAPYGSLVDAAWPLMDEDEAGVREAYHLLLPRKDFGRIAARRLRAYRSRPDLAESMKAYDSFSRRVAFLAEQSRPGAPMKTVPTATAWTAKRDELEAELIAKCPDFARLLQAPSVDAAIELLDDETAIVDVYDCVALNTEKKVGYAAKAFVLRKGRPVQVATLGDLETIERHFSEWRARRFGEKEAKGEDHGAALKRLLWKPLEPLLDGVRTVLVSPNPSLAGFPWPALAGKEKGSCLIEEYAFAVLPSVASFTKNARREPPAADGSLLCLANPNLKAAPGFTDVGDGPFAFTPDRTPTRAQEEILPFGGSEKEAKQVSELFQGKFAGRAATVLSGDEALEAAVRERLAQVQFAHVACRTLLGEQWRRGSTPLGLGFALSHLGADSYVAAPLAAIAVAGANSPSGFTDDPKRAPDDGFLTDAEISGMDLSSLDLVVLSASDAGLGTAGRGAGLIALQKALHDAGARSTLAGVWRTDESAMRAVVLEFYRNHWEKGMSRVEALREAQLRIMREYDPKRGKLRSPEDETEAEESKDEDSEEEKKPREKQTARQPPYFWAGFQLSGHWK
jgi:CHAT domain-containing protein